MSKRLLHTVTVSSVLFAITPVFAVHTPVHPTTFLGPTLRAGYVDNLMDCSYYSLAGEASNRNFRAGATLGWNLTNNQWLKISAEYLKQKISYAFFDGNTSPWVQQGAIGADYLYRITGNYIEPQFGLNIVASHAPAMNLHNVAGTQNISGVVTNVYDLQNIGGANTISIAPGIGMQFWSGTLARLDLNYDNFRYETTYHSISNVSGFGSTFHLHQTLSEFTAFNLSAGLRQPFNAYQANIEYRNFAYFGPWILGIGGDYTIGKKGLPTTWNAGISLNFLIQQDMPVGAGARDEVDHFMSWMTRPAVYAPQVYAVPNDQLTVL